MSEYGNGDYSHENERNNKIENNFELKDENINNEGIFINFEPIDEENSKYLSEKFEPLNENSLKEENLKLKSRRKLLYDNPKETERECGKCHQIKPYDDFKNRTDNKKKKKSICKKCDVKLEAHRLQMKSWMNKIEAIKYVTKGKNTCQICNKIGISKLPMLDFHHPYPELSTKSAIEKGFWRSVRYNSWEVIKKEIQKQKVKVVCRNCHQKKETNFFETHKKLIQKCKDPNSKLLDNINKQKKQQIKAHIRKKILILDLWNGKCTSCSFGITSKNVDNLPALEIHHEDPVLKKDNISFFIKRTTSIDKIKQIIKQEKATCLCRNCHIMAQSTFYNENRNDIFEKYNKFYGK